MDCEWRSMDPLDLQDKCCCVCTGECKLQIMSLGMIDRVDGESDAMGPGECMMSIYVRRSSMQKQNSPLAWCTNSYVIIVNKEVPSLISLVHPRYTRMK
eukprot:scaffold90216_cov78-Cyclotella_meneghiniana.AAC.2